MWFIFSVACMLFWGCADLFYKKGTDERDRYSHLKIAVWVGLVMGVFAFALMPFAETRFSVAALITSAIKYSPASLCYIISMVIGYAGLRYLEVSIVSPVQNASGAFSAVIMAIWFAIFGNVARIREEYNMLDVVGTLVIVAGVVSLAFVEQRLSAVERGLAPDERKYRFGALALLFPILYCLFDTVGTAADGIILDEDAGLGLGEIDVLILYGLTFFAAGIIAWIYMLAKNRTPYNPFAKSEIPKGVASLCEEGGQVFYVYAMASKPILAAPMVASYCIVSAILARIFIKEKLKAAQYACVAAVIVGIVALGVSDGLKE